MKFVKSLSLIAASFAMLLLTGCGESPEDVARKYMTALIEGDLDTMNKVSTAQTTQLNGFFIAAMENDPKKEEKKAKMKAGLKFDKTEIDGEYAKVYIEGNDNPMTLKKVDGEWKVDVKKN